MHVTRAMQGGERLRSHVRKEGGRRTQQTPKQTTPSPPTLGALSRPPLPAVASIAIHHSARIPSPLLPSSPPPWLSNDPSVVRFGAQLRFYSHTTVEGFIKSFSHTREPNRAWNSSFRNTPFVARARVRVFLLSFLISCSTGGVLDANRARSGLLQDNGLAVRELQDSKVDDRVCH